MIVAPAHQTDENATTSRKTKFFLYSVSTIYHDVHLIVYSCASLRQMRAVAGKGSRRTEIGVSGTLQGVVERKGRTEW